jgi:YjbE family integral membrane protein
MDLAGLSLFALVQVIWVNIILSGDNAVVIALACRGLPESQRKLGMVLGAGVAILLRIVFTLTVVALLSTPFLKIAGGLLLLWVAVKLITDDGEGDEITASDKLFHAVRTIAIADVVMSLDNVLAIAAVARDNTVMLILGLAISIPLIVAGAALIMKMLERFPILVWAGAALLGWLAGGMLASDPMAVRWLGEALVHRIEIPVEIVGAIFVVAIGWWLKRRSGVSETV